MDTLDLLFPSSSSSGAKHQRRATTHTTRGVSSATGDSSVRTGEKKHDSLWQLAQRHNSHNTTTNPQRSTTQDAQQQQQHIPRRSKSISIIEYSGGGGGCGGGGGGWNSTSGGSSRVAAVGRGTRGGGGGGNRSSSSATSSPKRTGSRTGNTGGSTGSSSSSAVCGGMSSSPFSSPFSSSLSASPSASVASGSASSSSAGQRRTTTTTAATTGVCVANNTTTTTNKHDKQVTRGSSLEPLSASKHGVLSSLSSFSSSSFSSPVPSRSRSRYAMNSSVSSNPTTTTTSTVDTSGGKQQEYPQAKNATNQPKNSGNSYNRNTNVKSSGYGMPSTRPSTASSSLNSTLQQQRRQQPQQAAKKKQLSSSASEKSSGTAAGGKNAQPPWLGVSVDLSLCRYDVVEFVASEMMRFSIVRDPTAAAAMMSASSGTNSGSASGMSSSGFMMSSSIRNSNYLRGSSSSVSAGAASRSSTPSLFWTDLTIDPSRMQTLHRRKMMCNHFCGIDLLCKKASMGKLLDRMRRVFPQHYDFFPQTYSCLQDLNKPSSDIAHHIAADDDNQTQQQQQQQRWYIVKPTAGCQGRDVRLTKRVTADDFTGTRWVSIGGGSSSSGAALGGGSSSLRRRMSMLLGGSVASGAAAADVQHHHDSSSCSSTGHAGHVGVSESMVVQNYIANPFLVHGRKCDLRCYVLIASVDPLEVYFFKEGIVRVCSSPYEPPTEENATSRTVHLANYAVNKNGNGSNSSTSTTSAQQQAQEHNNMESGGGEGEGEADSNSNSKPTQNQRPPPAAVWGSAYNQSPDAVKYPFAYFSSLLQSTIVANPGRYGIVNHHNNVGGSCGSTSTPSQDASYSGSATELRQAAARKVSKMWSDIHDVCVKTVIAGQHKIMELTPNMGLSGGATSGSGVGARMGKGASSSSSSSSISGIAGRSSAPVVVDTGLLASGSNHQHSQQSSSSRGKSLCFEVIGFDVLVDDNLRPWLIEANHSPSWFTDTDFDHELKRRVIRDALLLTVVPHAEEERRRHRTRSRRKQQRRGTSNISSSSSKKSKSKKKSLSSGGDVDDDDDDTHQGCAELDDDEEGEDGDEEEEGPALWAMSEMHLDGNMFEKIYGAEPPSKKMPPPVAKRSSCFGPAGASASLEGAMPVTSNCAKRTAELSEVVEAQRSAVRTLLHGIY